jgi:uncharacterized membrane protein YhhN
VNATAAVLCVVFVAVAAFDWAAVHVGAGGIRVLTKPGCMLVLIGAAAALDFAEEGARTAVLVALALSTVGDIFLLRGEKTNFFVAGLGAFLAAHLAYIVAFWLDGVSPGGVVAGLLVGAVVVGAVGARVVAAAKAGDEAALVGPVRAYVLVIAAMVASAVATADPLAIIGAGLFATSDSLIAWERFVRSRAWTDLVIIVTYHLAQLVLVLSFV